jgi:hypothetical protein
VTLKTGWNTIYFKNTTPNTIELTTTKPAETLQWQFGELDWMSPNQPYHYWSNDHRGEFITSRARYANNQVHFYSEDDVILSSSIYLDIWFQGQAAGVPLPTGAYLFHAGSNPPSRGFYMQKGEIEGHAYYVVSGEVHVRHDIVRDIHTIAVNLQTDSDHDGEIDGELRGHSLLIME